MSNVPLEFQSSSYLWKIPHFFPIDFFSIFLFLHIYSPSVLSRNVQSIGSDTEHIAQHSKTRKKSKLISFFGFPFSKFEIHWMDGIASRFVLVKNYAGDTTSQTDQKFDRKMHEMGWVSIFSMLWWAHVQSHWCSWLIEALWCIVSRKDAEWAENSRKSEKSLKM